MRIERTARLDLDKALPDERVGERAVHEADALLEPGLLVVCRRLERTLEVVDDRQELLDEPLGGARDQVGLVALGPLAEVVELRLQTLKRVEVLVALARDLLEIGCGRIGQLDRTRVHRGNLPVPPNPLHRSAYADVRLRLTPNPLHRSAIADVRLRLIAHDVLASSSSTTS